jgi:hypothetical protein
MSSDPTGMPSARPPATPLVVVPRASTHPGTDPTGAPTAREPGAPFVVPPLPAALRAAAPAAATNPHRRARVQPAHAPPVVRPAGALAATGGSPTPPIIAALTLGTAWVINRRRRLS